MDRMSKRQRGLIAIVAWVVLTGTGFTPGAMAEDAYYAVQLGEIVDALPPGGVPRTRDFRERAALFHPRAVLDGPGEVYIDIDMVRTGWASLHGATVAVRAPEPGDVRGTLLLPKRDLSGFSRVEFRIDRDRAAPEAREQFLSARFEHYRRLRDAPIPGGAWFRHRMRQTSRARGREDAVDPEPPPNPWRNPSEMERTYALMSGGLALSETLQLDRLLPPAADGVMTVDVDGIAGISVRAFDWGPYLDGLDPARDALADFVPADQHVVLFPSLTAMIDVMDRLDAFAAPIVPVVEPRAETASVRERYQEQLCLPLNRVARTLGPRLVESVALTGSDAYLRTGSDVAVLFASPRPEELTKALAAFTVLAGHGPTVRTERGVLHGTTYVGMRTEDRRICSYTARVGNVVVVTNSTAQLARLVRTADGDRPAIGSLPEYTFFRDRYPLGDEREAALLLLSDETIRRWCGPRWRIGTSRRTRAAAIMADIQAGHLDRLVAGTIERGPVFTTHGVAEGEELILAPRGISSTRYGSLAFQTPIRELEIDRVTSEEEALYATWRDRYQRRWRNAFDPIAARLEIADGRLAADVSVMPLIEGTEYADLIAISGAARLDPHAGDPHDEAVAHAVLAVDREAPFVQMYAGMFSGMTRMMDPLAWFGGAIALYADDDAVLDDLGAAGDDERLWEQLPRMPLALHLDVTSGMKLTAFLAGVRSLLEQTAPGMLEWRPDVHEGIPFVHIGPSARAGGGMDDLRLCYAASGDALVIATREDVLRRALDRQRAAAGNGQAVKEPPPAEVTPWLGENVAVRLDRRAIPLIEMMYDESLRQRMQLRSWRNIPILNEWHRRFPDEDAAALHERFWHRRPICPGGGSYQWNEQWQTMESSVYGHPGAPRGGDRTVFDAIDGIRALDLGLTFEPDGIRARVKVSGGPGSE